MSILHTVSMGIYPRLRSTPAAAKTVLIGRGGRRLLNARTAFSFWQRLRGLHAIGSINDDEALVIHPCRCIHTMSMSLTIDVAFLNASGKVIKLVSVAPRRISRAPGATHVIEMNHGTIQRLSLTVGDILTMESQV